MNNLNKILNINLPIILASGSPRRKKLLEQLGLEFEVIPANVDEEIDENLKPGHFVMQLAESKAKAVADNQYENKLVIAADTTVVHDGIIINKPNSKEEASDILNKLSNDYHFVYSGIAIMDTKGNMKIIDYEKTLVKFRELFQEEIDAYIETGAPMDKAGAYGIQDDFGAVFVESIEGCYYNVVGLPLSLLYTRLYKFFNEAKL